MTETRVTPWYRNTIEIDRKRIAQVNAVIKGRPVPQPANPRARITNAFLVAIMYDAGTYKAVIPPGPSREELLHMPE